MARVVVVGSANLDLRIRQDHLAAPGETLLARSARHELGGKGLNQAVAARRAGAEVTFVGAIGDDAAGSDIATLLAAEGVGVDGLAVAEDASGLAVVTITDDGENSIVVVPGANASVDPERVGLALGGLSPGDVVVCQLEVPLDAVRAALGAGRRAGATIVLNAAPAHPGVVGMLDEVDILVVNDTELEQLASAVGLDPAAAPAPRLSERFGLAVVHTSGSAGAWCHADGESTFQPARSVEAVDTTAAGDTFVGYLAAAVVAGDALTDALSIATDAAAVTVTRSGSAQSIPFRDEL